MLELEEVRERIGAFDEAALCYPWRHGDPEVERLCAEVQGIVSRGTAKEWPRRQVCRAIWEAAGLGALPLAPGRAEVPYLNEPWYC
jgi:hypothetical protein